MSDALHGVRVCVVGINYSPEPTGSAPYTAGLAEMLVEDGAEVEVVTGVPHYPSWSVDPAYRRRLRVTERINGVEVHRARHFVPGRQNALSRLLWDGTFAVNAALIRPNRTPDAVIASTPSLGGAAVGAALARRANAPFGVVVQDLTGQAASQSGIAGGGSVAAAAGWVEGRILRRADRVAVVSESFGRQLGEYGVAAHRVEVLPNWTHIAPPSRDRAAVRSELGWKDDVFVVLHTGNMGLKQDLSNVIEAARLLSADKQVLVVLLGHGNQRPALEAAGRGVECLQFLDPVSDEQYPDVLRAADLLLVNERPTVGEMSLPSKLTSYFAAGAPVLAAVSPDGACARELDRSGGAGTRVAPGDPVALADAVRELRGDPEGLASMGRAAGEYAARRLGRAAAAENVRRFVTRLVPRVRVSGGAS